MWILGRKGPSGFSACSTAEEVTKGIDGTGLTAIVTGASSGIGTETTRILALRGVHVVMAVRNTDTGRKAKEAILKENPNAKLDVMELDLGSMASVRKFGSEYKSSGLPLNLLIMSAQWLQNVLKKHDRSFECKLDSLPKWSEFQLRFIEQINAGHFLLTNILLETMKSTARESQKEGRIVIVSSEAHRWFRYPEGVRFDKINDKSSFRTMYAYGQSKLANILHANELAKRFKEEGVEITANSLHPGVIGTNILRHRWFVNGVLNTLAKYFFKSIPQGAATTCYVALHPQVKGVSGEYFSDSNLAKPIALAKDEELAKKLWDFSLSLTDLK
ncbi:hypothetical protein RHMOL_Rhmol02G0291700 [Rhododendron molle]|uniref:Uncharacterized protein n=1 Tax=Rhododendron molle TaxID=49168 RepID=A0ACC0PX37_RHOML|nr:hypothetical protein RHMOL_Rhmol02G0291700 [Rhododendron molle]